MSFLPSRPERGANLDAADRPTADEPVANAGTGLAAGPEHSPASMMPANDAPQPQPMTQPQVHVDRDTPVARVSPDENASNVAAPSDALTPSRPAPSGSVVDPTRPALPGSGERTRRRVVRVSSGRAGRRGPSARRTRERPSRLQRLVPIHLVVLLLTGLITRLIFFPHPAFTTDTELFRSWGRDLLRFPIRQFYPENPNIDHLPGDMWLHLLIAHVYAWFSPSLDDRAFTYIDMLKLVPSIADLGIAVGVFLIVRRLAGQRMAYRAGWATVLSPALIFESAIWGQWDAVSACVAVAAIAVFLAGRPEWAFPLLTYAVLVKPQMAALIPYFILVALLVYFVPHLGRIDPLRRPLNWLGNGRPLRPTEPLRASVWRAVWAVLLSVVVFLVTLVPFNVGLPLLPTRFTIQDRISLAVDYYSRTSFNAFNFWATYLVRDRPANDANIPDTGTFWFGLAYRTWGNIFTLVALATIAVLTVVIWRRVGAQVLIWASCATMFTMFMLPTRIHERYIIPAMVFSILLAFVAPRLWWVFAGLSVVAFFNLAYVFDLYYDIFGARTWYPFLFDRWFLPTISTFNLLLFGATVLIAPWIFIRQRVDAGGPNGARQRLRLDRLNSRSRRHAEPIVSAAFLPSGIPAPGTGAHPVEGATTETLVESDASSALQPAPRDSTESEPSTPPGIPALAPAENTGALGGRQQIRNAPIDGPAGGAAPDH